MTDRMIVILIAVTLDLLLGDPRRFHPVAGIGRLVSLLERFLRRTGMDGYGGGILLVLLVVGTVGGVTGLLTHLAHGAGRPVGLMVEGVTGFFCIAARTLHRESAAVAGHLSHGDLPAARIALSRIVGRDTDGLEEDEIWRGAVETVAENTSDGVIAPLLFILLFGGTGGAVYRAINTLDSMVGYRTERYRRFGWCAARLDDLANLVPSRLTALFIALAAPFCGGSLSRALFVSIRDGRNHSSPNSGYPEAAVAGALGIRLGGANRYFGRVVEKPTIGDPLHPLDRRAWEGAVRLMYGSELILVLLSLGGVLLREGGR